MFHSLICAKNGCRNKESGQRGSGGADAERSLNILRIEI